MEFKEIWKDIEGWIGIYQISNFGRLRSFKKDPAGYILSNKNKTGGYISVVLYVKGRSNRYVRMHVLVAEVFVPNPQNKLEINHKDGNKQNNFYRNLEWVTRKENSNHAMKNGLANIEGMNHYNQVLRPKTILQISPSGKVIGKYKNGVEAAKATGICARNILHVANQTEYRPGLTRKQAGGFQWRFDDRI